MKIEKQNKKVNQELKMANKQKKKEIENNYGVYFQKKREKNNIFR